MRTPRDHSVRAVLFIIIVGGVARVVLAACVGLSVDESYPVAISRRLALSYFDHPPLHTWLVGIWASLIGREDAVLVRMPFIVLFAGTTWLMYRLTATGITRGTCAEASVDTGCLERVFVQISCGGVSDPLTY